MTEQKTEEQKATQYEVHEMALQFPAQTPKETAQLRENMIQRVYQGLAPLESPILLVGGKIADGRHRYQIWQELAVEGTCDGYFAKTPPTVEESNENEAVALLRINARNLHHRTLSADQKAAIFLMQVEKYPNLKLLVEKVQAENQERMKAGKSVDGKSQGTTTNEKLATLAGDVSASTMKNVKAVQKQAPHHLADVANGKMSAKTALRKPAEAKDSNTQNVEQPKAKSPKPLKRKSPTDLGPKKNADETRNVVLRLNDSSNVALLAEFFEDFGIKAKSERKGEKSDYQFDGTAQDENNLLTFLSGLVVANGPMKLEIAL